MRDEIELFREANIQPFGVNPAGVESHERYAARFGFPFPLLSDRKRDVAEAYGALKILGKFIHRSVVLIDMSGQVVFAERGAPAPAKIVAAM